MQHADITDPVVVDYLIINVLGEWRHIKCYTPPNSSRGAVGTKAFERTREAIVEQCCPKLLRFTLEETKSHQKMMIVEIVDESNYAGRGAYVYQQRKDSDEKMPINRVHQ